MLFKRTCFVCLILFLAIICQNVDSNNEELDVNNRRGFFKDVENFFSGLFKSKKKYRQNTTKERVVKNLKRFTVKIHSKNLFPVMKSDKDLLRTNQSDVIQNETDYKYLNQSLLISDVDIDIILKGSSPKAYDNEIQSRKINFIRDNGFRITGNRQQRKAKQLIIFVTNKKQIDDDLLDRESSSSSFRGEAFKENILREEYGKACIKVAVRKCYKTIHNVKTIVCKTRFRCKSSFKSMFLYEAKRSCIIQFDPTHNLNKNIETEKNNGVHISKRDTALYITECMPHLVREFAKKTVRKLDEILNIKSLLRKGKTSTRKCQKLLRGKCYKACVHSYKQTCSNVDCSKRFRRGFKKECRRECSRQYLVSSDSSDSSESSSDS